MQHFKGSPDYINPAYNSKLGVYAEGCGLDNVVMSWGHDDYMYLVRALFLQSNQPSSSISTPLILEIMLQVAKENKTTLPSAALFIIRYHSFYGEYFCMCVRVLVVRGLNLFICGSALHKSGAYKYLMNEEDAENLKWLQIFKLGGIYLYLFISFPPFFDCSALIYTVSPLFFVANMISTAKASLELMWTR